MSDGATNVVIITAVAQSGDSRFNGFDPVDVALVNYETSNQAPTITGASNATTAEETIVSLNGIGVVDIDAGGSLIKVTLTASNGVISLANFNGVSFIVGDGKADSTMAFYGTVAAVNQAIDNLQFTPMASFSGAAQVDINVDDLGNSGYGGPQVASKVVVISVSAINKAPVILNTTAPLIVPEMPLAMPPSISNGTYIDLATVTENYAVSVAESFRDSVPNSYSTYLSADRIDYKASSIETTKAIGSTILKTALRDYRLREGRLEQQTSSAIIRLEELKKASRTAMELQLVDTAEELLNRRQFVGDAFQQLLATWKISQTDMNRIKAPVSLGDFEIPYDAAAGYVPLENIEKSVDVERYEAIVTALELSGFAVSAASVAWVARVTGLLAAVLAAFPVWKVFDPLHVLSAEEKKQLNNSLEFSDTDIRHDEEAVGAVF
jgi:hypothetical protein